MKKIESAKIFPIKMRYRLRGCRDKYSTLSSRPTHIQQTFQLQLLFSNKNILNASHRKKYPMKLEINCEHNGN